MEKFLDILNLSIPVALMFFGSLFTLLGVGADIWKIKVVSIGWKRVFLVIGIPTFLIGVLSAALFMYKIIFDAILAQPNFAFLWTRIYATRIALGGILLLLIAIYITRNVIREKGYELSVSAVVHDEHGTPDANILVENIGKGKIKCVARVVKVSFYDGKDHNEIKVDDINPNGRFLQWGSKNEYAVLTEKIPQVVNLITVDKNDGAKILFSRGAGYRPYSSPLTTGKYRLEINFFRINGAKQVYMCNFVRTLEIESKYRGISLRWEDAT